VILRDKLVTRGLKRLERRIKEALDDAIQRLDGHWCGVERDVHFTISEIAADDRRHWHYDGQTQCFVSGLSSDLRLEPTDELTTG
jgi:hypothetical protein